MKPEMITKALEKQGQMHYLAYTLKPVSINEEKHTAIFVMSTITPDRHGDVVDQKSWMLNHFHGAFFWAHKSDEFPLGQWLRVWLEPDPENADEVMLMGEVEFAVDLGPDILRAWRHVVRGDLKMVSVGFIPGKVSYDNERELFVLALCELMECSLVGIGANRRALVKDIDPTQTLIDTKKQIEESIEDNDPAATRKMHGITLLNKAIRQLTK